MKTRRLVVLVLACQLLVCVMVCIGCSAPNSNGPLTSNNSESSDISEAHHIEKVVIEPVKELHIEDIPHPITLEERFSYTYGYLLMQTAMRDVKSLNPIYFARGVLDFGVKKSPLVPQQEMNSVLFEYQDRLITEAARRLEELARKNLDDAESFLAVNGQREGIVTTKSGLQYEIITNSEGDYPKETDVVRVNYRLTYLDGREGDSSIKGIPSTFNLSSMIPGFREGLMLMPVGSTFRFYVHPKLGYGETGSTKIEPNTLLIFDVTLISIVK